MTLTFENEQDFDLGFDPEEVAAAVINGVLDQEACPYEAEVELILTDPENIRTMNREHRNIDRETDVLSFPMVDYPSPASFDFLETEEGDDCFNPDSGELMLGDIVISVARARAQAEEYGHSLRREFAFLVAHSMLHLLGYDHMTPEEAAVMEAKQEEVLQRLGCTGIVFLSMTRIRIMLMRMEKWHPGSNRLTGSGITSEAGAAWHKTPF